MKIFNVVIKKNHDHSKIDDESLRKENNLVKSRFQFGVDKVKFNNKFIENKFINQRLRIDKNINTDDSNTFVLNTEDNLTLYAYKSYNVCADVSSNIVLNNRNLNPLILKNNSDSITNNYEVMYITFDSSYKLIEYTTNNKIISTYHRVNEFYGLAVYYDRDKYIDNPIFTAYVVDSNNNLNYLEFSIDANDHVIMNSTIITKPSNEYIRKMNKGPIRFKVRLNPHRIPTQFVIVDEFEDESDSNVYDLDKIKDICDSKDPIFMEIGDNKFDDPEFIKYLHETITDQKIKAITLIDVRIPDNILKELKILYAFTYDTSKKIVKCIRSN